MALVAQRDKKLGFSDGDPAEPPAKATSGCGTSGAFSPHLFGVSTIARGTTCTMSSTVCAFPLDDEW